MNARADSWIKVRSPHHKPDSLSFRRTGSERRHCCKVVFNKIHPKRTLALKPIHNPVAALEIRERCVFRLVGCDMANASALFEWSGSRCPFRRDMRGRGDTLRLIEVVVEEVIALLKRVTVPKLFNRVFDLRGSDFRP